MVWASLNVVEKTIISKFINKPGVYTFYIGVIVGSLGFLIILFNGLKIPSASVLIAALSAGFLFIYAVYPYFKSLTFEEVSRVVPLWQTIPLFVLILEFVFIKEKLSVNNYIAFSLLLLGGILISVKRVKGFFKVSKAFYWMLSSSFLLGIIYILRKYIMLNHFYWDNVILLSIGTLTGAFSLLFFKNIRKEFLNVFYSVNNKIRFTVIGTQILNGVATLSNNYALVIAPASLVSVSSSVLQPFFVLIYAILLSKFLPNLLKEEVNKKILLNKIIAIVLMSLGLFFLIVLK